MCAARNLTRTRRRRAKRVRSIIEIIEGKIVFGLKNTSIMRLCDVKRLLRYLLTRRFDGDLDTETQAHIDEKAEAYAAAGMPMMEAQARA